MRVDETQATCQMSTVDERAGVGPAQMSHSATFCVVGIDPGITGALAVIDTWGALRSVHDIPTTTVVVAGKQRTRVCPYGLDDLLLKLSVRPLRVFMEELAGAPSRGTPIGGGGKDAASHRMGGSQAFSLGRSYGLLEGVLAAHRVSLTLVRPQAWQKGVGLGGPGMDKTQRKSLSRATAARLWPGFAQLFARVKDDGRSDAALIAQYGFMNTTKMGL